MAFGEINRSNKFENIEIECLILLWIETDVFFTSKIDIKFPNLLVYLSQNISLASIFLTPSVPGPYSFFAYNSNDLQSQNQENFIVTFSIEFLYTKIDIKLTLLKMVE